MNDELDIILKRVAVGKAEIKANIEAYTKRQVVAALEALKEKRTILTNEQKPGGALINAVPLKYIDEAIAALKPSGIPVSKADYVRLANEVREIEEEKK
jgi:hypothetical protein